MSLVQLFAAVKENYAEYARPRQMRRLIRERLYDWRANSIRVNNRHRRLPSLGLEVATILAKIRQGINPGQISAEARERVAEKGIAICRCYYAVVVPGTDCPVCDQREYFDQLALLVDRMHNTLPDDIPLKLSELRKVLTTSVHRPTQSEDDPTTHIAYSRTQEIHWKDKKHRTKIAFRRFLSRHLTELNLTSSQIDQWGIRYTGCDDCSNWNLREVTGDDIGIMYKDWEGTELQSCMTGTDYLGLYENNPDVFSLGIWDCQGSTMARALIWKKDDKKYLSRVYCIHADCQVIRQALMLRHGFLDIRNCTEKSRCHPLYRIN